MPKGLLVDLWGTLFWPSLPLEDYYRLRSQKILAVLKNSGFAFNLETVYHAYIEARRLADKVRNTSHHEIDVIGEMVILLDKLGVEPREDLLSTLVEATMYPYTNNLSLTPGAREVLELAGRLGYKVILASNTMSGEYTVQLLRKAGILHLFDFLAFSDEIGFRKPHPRFFSRIISHTGITPIDSVFVGDEEGDIEGAKKFGMKTIAFTGFQEYKGRTPPDYLAGSMEEVRNILESLTLRSRGKD
ncbi:MAG: HAD family hydrolase [Infirmifilum sp.]